MPNHALSMFSQFLRSPRIIGAIVPSSRGLAEQLVDQVDFSKPSTVIEFGIGTGAITSVIAERLQPHTRYAGIEINKKFYDDMKLRYPKLNFVNRSAADVEDVLKMLGVTHADAIISGIPWASLPAEIQSAILDAGVKALRPGGIFVTFAYLQGMLLPGAHRLRRQLKSRFAKVETTPIVWKNVPPAFTYVCTR